MMLVPLLLAFQIGRVDHPPALDTFLDMQAPEAVDHMTRIEGLITRIPRNGEPVSERTVVYAGYDNAALYFVYVAFDSRPDLIRARLVNRDLIPSYDDTVAVFLDTFHDRKRCYGFQVNARGVQNDAVWTEGGTWDFSWDAVWHSEARITHQGYVALIAIPFKSLRFRPADVQTWGVFLYRGIPRKNEEAYWPAYSTTIAGRLNQEGDIDGLTSVSPGRNMQAIPYTSFLAARTPAQATTDAQAGVDAKLILHDSIVADLTVNPDFSQVESDVPQETVNQRFEVFFPEKRPFFIENASYFDTPLQLLFTRRIADPQHGLKVTGKVGRYGVGALVIDDQSPGELAPPGDSLFRKSALFRALRITRDVGSDSSIGGAYVERSVAGTSNSVGGVDARARLTSNWIATAQAVASKTTSLDGQRSDGTALHGLLLGSWTTGSYQLQLDDLSPDFRADAGFITRTGIRQAQQTISYRVRPSSGPIVSWGPDIWTNDIRDHGGDGWLEQSVQTTLSVELPRLTTISAGFLRSRQRLIPREFPQITEPLGLPDRRWELTLTTSAIPRTTASFDYIGGEEINFIPAAGVNPYTTGTRTITSTLEFHPSDSMTVQNNVIYTSLSSTFIHRIVRTKVSYQFSRALSVRTIIADDRLSVDPARASLVPHKQINADFLVAWLLNPGTALYVGYNTNYADDLAVDLRNNHRQLFMKVSYLVRF